MHTLRLVALALLLSFEMPLLNGQSLPAAEPLQLLFLGDNGHHQPRARADQIIPVLAKTGIEITYTDDITRLSDEGLKDYAGVIVYANIDTIPPAQERALLDFVSQGGGFIPLHCASYCFRNSAPVVDLIGAQFSKHGGEEFSTEIVAPQHPIMRGFGGFESWDETYIHTKHNSRNRIVLETRSQGEQAAGNTSEPWTWIRTHGNGRVFYTAWGHDARTWGHPGFQNLLQRGILWACQADVSQVADYQDPSLFSVPKMTAPRQDVAKFEYADVGPKIPNYLAGKQWGVQGEILSRMQKPLAPEESLKHYVTPEQFHLELFATEADFDGKPIAMNWDHRGRLWICETVDYPNELMPPEQGRDHIRICEDTDGDGRADKFTLFADKLSIPTSIEFCRDGVIVQAGIQTLFLRDTDGDDQCDEREVLISGWQMGDTHGGVSNFQYGLDNRYWAMQGYNNSKPRYATGEHPGFRQGPFNFTIDGSDRMPRVVDIEFIRSTTNNSWGLGLTEEGLIFASTANRAPSFFVPIPNRYYERVRGWTPSLTAEAIAPDHYFDPITQRVRQVDHHGGYTAGAGHAIYTARTYPRHWWNRTAFVCGPTGHLVGTFVLKPEGSSFRDRNDFNLVASIDEWAAPIMAEVGPDGHVWILDWYNYIVQHNPTPKGFKTGKGNAYESDLRDKTHGRIYRLVYDGDAGEPGADRYADLNPSAPASLLHGLSHSNRLWRRHAQRLLVERGKLDVVSQLVEIAHGSQVDSTGNNPAVIHALWTLKGLGVLEQAEGKAFRTAVKALSHPAAGVRRNAALVLPPSDAATQAMVASGIAYDKHPQVRLAGLMALADMPAHSAAGELLAALVQDRSVMSDRYFSDAVICASAIHGESFLLAAMTSQIEIDSQPQHALMVVAEHMARGGISPTELQDLLSNLGQASPQTRLPILQGLAAGWPNQSSMGLNAAADAALEKLLDQAGARELGPLLRLGTLWGSRKLEVYAAKLTKDLLAIMNSHTATTEDRVQAANDLVSLAGDQPKMVSQLVELIGPQMPPAAASGIVRSLTAANPQSVGAQLLKSWSRLTPSLREDAIAVMLSRPVTTEALLDGAEASLDGATNSITLADLSLDQRQSLTSHPDRAIRRRANRLVRSSGSVISADRQEIIEQYVAATERSGDPGQGKELFKKNCANCHKHSGEGTEIGPDLTGMAVHPKEELLIHILDPSRSVEGNFRRYTLLTADGHILSGMLAAESLSAIEIIDGEGKRQSISREDVEQLNSTNKSVMPEGFEQQLNQQAMTDLLEFLTNKGKFVPLPLGSVASAVSTKPLFTDRPGGADQMIFQDWSAKVFQGVPFQLVDPLGSKRANIVLLNGPHGTLPPHMPKQVSLPCNMLIKNLHFLSGVSGWGFPYSGNKSVSLIVRLHYEDGQSEDHELLNGVHFADYIRRVDVPESTFAFALRSQQLRYLAIQPQRREPVLSVELIKGPDASAPIVMAITAEQWE